MTDRPRRLLFGEVAELYDAARPSYPDALIDDLAGWASDDTGPPRALEIGAGTGKATRLMVARGVSVTAIEPSVEMAAIAQRSAPAQSGLVELIGSDFEHAELGGRRFPLVYAAQAWHWLDQPIGFQRARDALEDGGRLVALWNGPVWGRTAIRAALDAAYDRHAPDLEAGIARPADRYDAGDWAGEVARAEGFEDAEVRGYDWSISYRPQEYVDLVATHSEIRLLPDGTRETLLEAVRDAIVSHGGVLELPMHVRACIARAAG